MRTLEFDCWMDAARVAVYCRREFWSQERPFPHPDCDGWWCIRAQSRFARVFERDGHYGSFSIPPIHRPGVGQIRQLLREFGKAVEESGASSEDLLRSIS